MTMATLPLLAAFAAVTTLHAQPAAAPGLPDQPVAADSLAPEVLRAFRAPLAVEVTRNALHAAPAPRQSFVSGMNYFHSLNAINHEHGGFEPMAFRPKFRAKADDPDKVVLDAEHAQSLAEGFFDGARVRVYQPVNGRLVKIRDGIVPEGGHCATGWLETRSQITTLKDKTAFAMKLDGSFLPDRDYWFCVKAVDKFQQYSAPSNVVQARSGEAKGQKEGDKSPGWHRFQEPPPDMPAPPPAPKNLAVAQDGEDLRFTWDPVESEHLHGYKIFVSPVAPERQKGFSLRLASRAPEPERVIQKNDIVFVDQIKTTLNPADVSPYVNWPALRKAGSPFKGVFFQEPYKLWSDGSDGYPAKWAFEKHPEPVPAEFTGKGATCLKWEVAGEELTGFPVTPYGGRKDTFYPALEPGEYTVEAWVRGSGKAQIIFVGGPFAPKGVAMPYKQQAHPANKLDIPPVDLPLAGEWTKAVGTFRVPEYFDEGLGFIMLVFQGPGVMHMDNLRIFRTGEPYGRYPEVTLRRIHESNMRFMRTHELIKTSWGYTLEGMTGAACGNNYSAGVSHNQTFFALLDNMRAAGNISPWLQIEMCLSEEEWLGFAEWFCAPYDPAKGDTPEKKPWAFKRWSMGQRNPWIDEFPEFAFEISNETWNQTFKPYDWDWGMAITDGATGRRYSYGATYGLFNEYVLGVLKRSPYWTEAVAKKTKSMLCGWTAALQFGSEAARLSQGADSVTYAAYVHNQGLGDPKVASDFKRFYVMQWPMSGVDPQFAKAAEAEARLRAEGVEVESGIYEYGYAYFVMPGDPKEAKETDQQLARSMAGATAIFDAAMTAYRHGVQDQAFFTFGHQIGAWGSHTTLAYGGHAYPFWKALTLFNTHGAGTFLDTKLASVPRWDFPAYETEDNMHKVKRAAMPGAPLVSAHATVNGGRVAVFLVSRKLDNFPVAGDDGFTPATLQLPFPKAKKITLHKLAGDPRADDRFEELHKVESVEIPATAFQGALTVNEKTGADARGLPPASIFCYVFEGVEMGKVNLPPVARFSLPEVVVAGEPVTITNRSASGAGEALSYSWDLGVLGAATEPQPSATFPEAGFEKIEQTAVSPAGLSNSLARLEQVVAVRFGGAVWRPGAMPSQSLQNVRARIEEAGRLVLRGKGAVQGRGTYPSLLGDPRYRRNFTLEAVMEGIEAPEGDAKACAGLVLAAELNEGLGFGWGDYKAVATVASLLVAPNGAVRVLRGQADQTAEVLPAGAVVFPAKVRIAVNGGVAAASVELGGAWKQVAEFPCENGAGLMPGLAAGSGGGETKVTVSALSASP